MESYKELAEKGGGTLWFGMTSGIIDTLREHLGKPAASSVSIAASKIVVLGELLTCIPYEYLIRDRETHEIDEIGKQGTIREMLPLWLIQEQTSFSVPCNIMTFSSVLVRRRR
jgi:hypothetical protein